MSPHIEYNLDFNTNEFHSIEIVKFCKTHNNTKEFKYYQLKSLNIIN